VSPLERYEQGQLVERRSYVPVVSVIGAMAVVSAGIFGGVFGAVLFGGQASRTTGRQEITFLPPDQPTLDATVIDSSTVRLSGSAFSGDRTDTHASSDWQVVRIGGDFDQGTVLSALSSDSLEQITFVSNDSLKVDTLYSARVRYTGVGGGDSEWADTTVFRPSGVVQPLFSDGFETGDYSHVENSYDWNATAGTPDQAGSMSDGASPHEGSWAGRFRQTTSAENRLLEVGGPSLSEYWWEYYIRVPTNYDHIDSPSSDNNKWAEFFLGANRGATLVWSETERNSAQDGGSRWRINWGADENFSHTTATDNGIVLPDDLGVYMRVRYHIRIQDQGSGNANAYIQIWKNDTKIFDGTSDTWPWQGEAMVHNRWQVMGFNNGEFAEVITWYVDSVKLYDTDPGW
jgi:hypothetical protein